MRLCMHIYLEKPCGHSNPIASSTVYKANWKLNPHPTLNITLPFVSETHFQSEVLGFRLYLPTHTWARRPQAHPQFSWSQFCNIISCHHMHLRQFGFQTLSSGWGEKVERKNNSDTNADTINVYSSLWKSWILTSLSALLLNLKPQSTLYNHIRNSYFAFMFPSLTLTAGGMQQWIHH